MTTAQGRAKYLLEALDGFLWNDEEHPVDRPLPRLSGPVRILEVGSARNYESEISDGHSTRWLAQWVRDHDIGETIHEFHSIDLRITFARRLLADHHLDEFCHLHQGDARLVIPQLRIPKGGLHLAYLDAADDPDLTVELHGIVLPYMHADGIMAFDDWDRADPRQTKWKRLRPLLEEWGVPIQMRDRIAFIRARDVIDAQGHAPDGSGGAGHRLDPPGIHDSGR